VCSPVIFASISRVSRRVWDAEGGCFGAAWGLGEETNATEEDETRGVGHILYVDEVVTVFLMGRAEQRTTWEVSDAVKAKEVEMSRKNYCAAGFGMLLVCFAFSAFATDYIVYGFNAAADCAITDSSNPWRFDNQANAPWTPSFVGTEGVEGVLRWTPSQPGEGEEYRLYNNKKYPDYKNTKIADYPWAKVKMTLSGIPEGQTVLVKNRLKLCDSGGTEVNRRMHKEWTLGNGTYILSMYMGDSSNCIDGDENPTTVGPDDRYYRGYLYLDITTVAGWDTPPWDVGDNPCELITMDVDWIAYTDNEAYPDGSAGVGGEITMTAVQQSNLAIVVGDSVTLTAPASGSTVSYIWFKDGEVLANDPGHISGADSGILVIDPVAMEDSGEYFCVYDDGSKAIVESEIFTLVVSGDLPIAGIAGLAAAAVALAGLAARRMRRR